ncbi:MAG: DUF4272 domain-containing protein [Flavisolibacter sp.]
MTPAERKSRIENLLTSLNIPYIGHLPLIEESEARVRTPQEIANRICVLMYLYYVSKKPQDRNNLIVFLKEQKLWEAVSSHEKELFTIDVSGQEQIKISWRTEAIWLLLWAINKVDKLELPVDRVSISEIFERIPGFMEDTKEFVQTATGRTTPEILDVADLTHRLHWATQHTELNGPLALNLNSNIVQERHHAINWAIYYADNWDEITTDS